MPDDLCYEHGTLMDITDSLKVLETHSSLQLLHMQYSSMLSTLMDSPLACYKTRQMYYESVNVSCLVQNVLSYLCMYSSVLFHIAKVKADFIVLE